MSLRTLGIRISEIAPAAKSAALSGLHEVRIRACQGSPLRPGPGCACVCVKLGVLVCAEAALVGVQLAYMKKPEDKYFRGVVKLEECIIEELVDKEDLLDGPDTSASSLSDNAAKPGARQVLKSNSSLGQAQTLAFRITNKTPYKSVVKGEPPLPPSLHPMWPLLPGAAPGDSLVRCSTWCLPPAGPGQKRPALQCWPPPGLLSLLSPLLSAARGAPACPGRPCSPAC